MILQELTPESVVSPTECLQQEPFPSDVATSNYQDSLPIDRFIVDLPDAVGTLGQQMFFEASASGDLSRRTVPSSHVDLLADHLLPLLCTQLLRQDPGCCCNTGWCYRFLSHFVWRVDQKKTNTWLIKLGGRFSLDETLKVTDRWDWQIWRSPKDETRCSIDGWLRHAFGWSSFRGRPWCSSPLCIHEGGFFRSCCSKSWFSIPKGRSSCFFLGGGKLYTTMDW